MHRLLRVRCALRQRDHHEARQELISCCCCFLQQQELENFEHTLIDAKEARKRELLEERRKTLADAFQNDLKTYQALVSYQGEGAPKGQQEVELLLSACVALMVVTRGVHVPLL